MLSARLIQLPVLPIGVLLLAYECSAVSAVGDPSPLPSAAVQIDSLAAADHDIPPVDEAIGRRAVAAHLRSLVLISVSVAAASLLSDSSAFAVGEAAPRPVGAVPSEPSARSSPAATAEPTAQQDPQAQGSPSILQMLDGREQDAWIGAGIAATFFFLGWISGGSYHVRRERRRRTRLRF